MTLFHSTDRHRVCGRRIFRARPPFIACRLFLGEASATSLDRTTPNDFCNSNDERALSRAVDLRWKETAISFHFVRDLSVQDRERAPKAEPKLQPASPRPSAVFACFTQVLSTSIRCDACHSKWLGSLRAERPRVRWLQRDSFPNSKLRASPSGRCARLSRQFSSTHRHRCSLSWGLEDRAKEGTDLRLSRCNVPREGCELLPNQSAFHRNAKERAV